MMKFYKINDIEGFMGAVDKCTGRVEIVSSDGDVINLKSKLSQFFSLSKLLGADPTEIPELELHATEPEDVKLLMNYMIMGEEQKIGSLVKSTGFPIFRYELNISFNLSVSSCTVVSPVKISIAFISSAPITWLYVFIRVTTSCPSHFATISGLMP